MINANELRIGNWVYPNEENATPYQVKGIQNDEMVDFGLASFNGRVQILASELYPNPLTPEILLACGFIKDEEGDYWIVLVTNCLKAMFMNDGVYPVWFCVAELSSDREQMASLNRINHLHQLQNLYFALTGEELNYSPWEQK